MLAVHAARMPKTAVHGDVAAEAHEERVGQQHDREVHQEQRVGNLAEEGERRASPASVRAGRCGG